MRGAQDRGRPRRSGRRAVHRRSGGGTETSPRWPTCPAGTPLPTAASPPSSSPPPRRDFSSPTRHLLDIRWMALNLFQEEEGVVAAHEGHWHGEFLEDPAVARWVPRDVRRGVQPELLLRERVRR